MKSLPFLKCMVIAVVVATIAGSVIGLCSPVWEASGGSLPTATLAMLALALLMPLLARLMRHDPAENEIDGHAAVIVGCRCVTAIGVVVMLFVSDSFRTAVYVYEPIRFGELAFTAPLAFALYVAGGLGACAGWVEVRIRAHRWDHATYDELRTSGETKRQPVVSVAGWCTIGLAALVLVVVCRKSLSAPTPEQYTSRLVHVGDVPPVMVTIPREQWGPNRRTNYPHFIPTAPVGEYYVARYCNETHCELWISRDPLPATNEDRELFPNTAASVTISARSSTSIDHDPTHHLLLVRSEGEKKWFATDTLSGHFVFAVFGPDAFAVPSTVCAGGLVGILLGIYLLRRSRNVDSSSKKKGASTLDDDDFEPARVTKDGRIMFDDDRPAAHVPGAHRGVDADVLVQLDEPRAATFRDTGAPKVKRVFFGSVAELRAEQLQALDARTAVAITITLLLIAPVAAGIFLGMI